MNADLLVAIAVFFTVLGLGVAFASLGSRKSARLQARLARHSLSVATDTPERTARVNVLGRSAAAFEGLLAETLDVITGSLRAGQGLMQAIESTSQEQPEPMRSELRRIVDQVNMGMSISDAMGTLTTRFDSRDVDLLAAAIAINRESGGNLSEVLNNLAATVRQRRDIRAEAKSLTAAPRATSYMLAILPLVIAGYTTAISPIYREQLFHAPLGRALLIGACVWSLIGFFISQKLAKVEY
jgi:tight adherence protein B